MVTASSLCSSPSVLTPFGYSALVPAVSTYPVFTSAEPYIIDCVALLYRVLSLFSFSLSYCILHIVWLILNSGD